MELMDSCEIFLWPVINGLERAVSYKIELTELVFDSYDEPGCETWEMIEDSEEVSTDDEVQIWIPPGMLEKMCRDHFKLEY